MALADVITSSLGGLINQVGSVDKVNKLPQTTLFTAINFAEDKLAIQLLNWAIELPDMDIAVGYEVYDRNYTLLYNEDSSLELTTAGWGSTPLDIYLLFIMEVGEFVWLAYRKLDGTDRVVMLIKF